jgi:hypothetical protein
MINYVNHVNKSIDLFQNDQRITPHHISLYLTLFNDWNRNRFKNPIQISRRDIMIIAKVKSNSTYQKLMKNLTDWGYIKYSPHQNPMRGSKVSLTDLCTTDILDTGTVEDINNTNIKTKRESEETPTLKKAIEYFISKGSTQIEAQKFFNHYESNGWKVGGKTPMKNWQASVENWILKSEQFNPKKQKSESHIIERNKQFNQKNY